MIRSLRLLCAISTILLYSALHGQTSIPSNTIVTQDFNSIGTGATVALPDNWKMSSAGNVTGWTDGSNATSTTHAANSGLPSTGGRYNWATAGNTDRAIGFMTDAGYSSPNAITAYYQNNTGATVNSLTIAFAVERYVVNTASASVAFSTSTDGVSFTPQPPGDISTATFSSGAHAGTFASPQTVYKTVTINGLNIPANGDIFFRWTFTNTGNINAQGLGLDDVSVFAGAATPALIAQLRDILQVDNGVKNQFSEGDVIRYATVIKNIGTGDANNVEINIPAPSNTTLVSGSIKTSALAKDDNFSTAFNTAISGGNVLSNDFGLPSPTVVSFGSTKNGGTTTAGSTGASDNGGSVLINADGTFSYTPPAGFIGNDQFSYVASTGNLPDNDAVVTVAVGTAPNAVADNYNVIGNVSINPGAGSGILSNDAGSLLKITAVNGSAANVAAAITTAQGGNLTVNADGSFTYNPPAGFEGNDNFVYTIDNGFASKSTATVTLTVGGMVWFINNNAPAGGDGRVSSPFNSIAAFQAVNNGISNNPGANDNIFVYESATAYTGSLTLLNGQRLIGQDATTSLSVITGLIPNPFYSTAFPPMNADPFVATLTTTVAATNAVNLGLGNTLRGFTLGATTGSGISGNGFGTLIISEVSKNGTGQGLALTNGAFGSPAIIDNVTTSSSSTAVSLTTCTGSLTIGAGNITGTTSSSFVISGGTASVTFSGSITQSNNAAMVSINGGHATGTITFNTGTLNATNGTGLQFDNADGAYNFNGTTTLNGGDAGVDILNGSAGKFNFTNAVAITNPVNEVIKINASTADVTYSGSFKKDNNGVSGIFINGETGGIIKIDGTGLKALSTSTGNAINLANNTGATINFSGNNLTITTTGGTGFNATGGGTISVAGTGNTITTTTGTALNVVNTTIGASHLNFQSISVNGAANGIVLNTTGANGGLIVTGSGSTAHSGGTLQATTANGVSVTSAGNIQLKFMRFLPANVVSSSGFVATNMTGTNLLEKCFFDYQNQTVPGAYAFRTVNTSTNATITLDATTFQNKMDGTTAVSLSAMGSSVITFNVLDNNTTDAFLSKYTNLFGSGIVVGAGDDAGSTANVTFNVSNTQFRDAPSNGLTDLEMGVGQNAILIPNISNNTFDKIGLAPAIVGVININTTGSGKLGSATTNTIISGNTISNIRSGAGPTYAYDGVAGTNGYVGIRIVIDNSVPGIHHRIQILNNTITNIAKQGLLISTRTSANDVNVLVQGNTIGTTANPVGTPSSRRGVEIEAQASSVLKLQMLNNNIVGGTTASNSALHIRSGASTGAASIYATIVNNTIGNPNGATTGRFRAETLAGSGAAMCLDLRNNFLEDGSRIFEVTNNSGLTYNLNQGGNTGTVISTGSITVTGACSLPNF